MQSPPQTQQLNIVIKNASLHVKCSGIVLDVLIDLLGLIELSSETLSTENDVKIGILNCC